MEWLTQNWIWVVVVIVFLLLMQRGRVFLGHHQGHHGARYGADDAGHGHGGGGAKPGAALDPVSGNPIRTDRALTAVHGGRAFYFESAETRQRFEAEPGKYAANATAAADTEPQRRHRHGC